MQILHLRCPKQIYWIVHAVLTHDLGECKKNIIYEESTLVQVMAWCWQRAVHYFSQCWNSFMSLHGVIILQFGLVMPYSQILSTLAQVIAFCLTAPIHYLNKYWLIIVISNFKNSSSITGAILSFIGKYKFRHTDINIRSSTQQFGHIC